MVYSKCNRLTTLLLYQSFYIPKTQNNIKTSFLKKTFSTDSQLTLDSTYKSSKTPRKSFVSIYTDGACPGNGTPGSVGGIGIYFGPNDPRNLSESIGETTNQRAELTAIIQALKIMEQSSPHSNVKILSDSKYSVLGATEYLHNWKLNGWNKSDDKPVANKDLWLEIDEILQTRAFRGVSTQFKYVKAHSTSVQNNQADKLASNASRLKETLTA